MCAESPRADLSKETRRVLFWGRTFVGQGDLDLAAQAVVRADEAAGLTRQERRDVDGRAVEITAVQSAPWRAVCRKGLLQKVVWRLESREGTLRVTSDFRMSGRYARRTGLLALLVGIAFAATVLLDARVFTGNLRWLEAFDLPLVMLAMGLALRLTHRFRALGGPKGDQLWRALLTEIEGAGGILEPADIDAGRRYVWSLTAFLLYVLAIFAGWLVAEQRLDPQSLHWEIGELLFVGLLLSSIAFLVGSVFAMNRYPGFGERVAAIQTGLATSFSVLFFLYSPLAWLFLQTRDLRADLVEDPRFRMLSWFVLAATAVLLVGSVSIFLQAISVAKPSRDSLLWNRGHEAWKISRAAAGGPSVVDRFRWIFLPLWAMIGLLVAAGAILMLLIVASAFTRVGNPAHPTVLATTRLIVASALGISPGSTWLGPVASAAWLLYAASVGCLFALSIGQLWHARRRARRELRRGRPDPATPAGRRLLDIGSELCRAAGLPRLRLAVRHQPSIRAWSSSFGPLGGERYVEVTTGALETLGRDELAALLAHEIAHHLHHRPTRDNLFRWLGRLTFVGDGFSRAVQHSFGYEEEADRTALELLKRCGAPRPKAALALRATLLKIKHTNPLCAEPPRPSETGIAAAAAPTSPRPGRHRDSSGSGSEATDGRGARWRRALRDFLDQYTSGLELHYWHPSQDQRLATLAEIAKISRQGGDGASGDFGWSL